MFTFSKSNQLSHLVFTPVLEGKNYCFIGQMRNVRHRDFVICFSGWIQDQSQGLLSPRNMFIWPFTLLSGPECCSTGRRFQNSSPLLRNKEQEPLGDSVDFEHVFERGHEGGIHVISPSRKT